LAFFVNLYIHIAGNMKTLLLFLTFLISGSCIISAQDKKSYIDYKKGVIEIDTLTKEEALEILEKFTPGVEPYIMPNGIAYSPSVDDGKRFFVLFEKENPTSYHGHLIKFNDVVNIVYKKRNLGPGRRSIFIITKNNECFRWNFWSSCKSELEEGYYNPRAPAHEEGTCASMENIMKVVAALVTMCPNLTAERKFDKLSTRLYDIISVSE
jgi:hypothetical protein